MEVGKFMITGIIGFVGIGLKEKVISFISAKANKAQIPINKCESLDFVEANTQAQGLSAYVLLYGVRQKLRHRSITDCCHFVPANMCRKSSRLMDFQEDVLLTKVSQ